MTLDVASGAELTVDGSVRINGTPGFQGSLFKGGGGTLYADRRSKRYNWELHNGNGNTVIKDGAVVTFDSRPLAAAPAPSASVAAA